MSPDPTLLVAQIIATLRLRYKFLFSILKQVGQKVGAIVAVCMNT